MIDHGPETIHDVLRGLIRGFPNHEGYQRAMLTAVDAHEKGFGSRSDYEEELRAQAKALEPPAPPDARDEKIAAQEAELAQLRAEAAARAAAYTPPPAPVETSIASGPPARVPDVTPAEPVRTSITSGPNRPL